MTCLNCEVNNIFTSLPVLLTTFAFLTADKIIFAICLALKRRKKMYIHLISMQGNDRAALGSKNVTTSVTLRSFVCPSLSCSDAVTSDA